MSEATSGYVDTFLSVSSTIRQSPFEVRREPVALDPRVNALEQQR
jgi:hypothetical protein